MQSDPVNPSHYKGDYAMRVIEDFELDFLKGTVIKYLLRAGKKDDELQDLQKAEWYLQRKIANLQRTQSSRTDNSDSPDSKSSGKRKIESWNTSYSPS